jgi:hypothetical protein
MRGSTQQGVLNKALSALRWDSLLLNTCSLRSATSSDAGLSGEGVRPSWRAAEKGVNRT